MKKNVKSRIGIWKAIGLRERCPIEIGFRENCPIKDGITLLGNSLQEAVHNWFRDMCMNSPTYVKILPSESYITLVLKFDGHESIWLAKEAV